MQTDSLVTGLAGYRPYLPFFQLGVMLIGSILTFFSLVLAYRALRFQTTVPLRNLRQSAFFELVVKPAIEASTAVMEKSEPLLRDRLGALRVTQEGGSLPLLTNGCAELNRAWKDILLPVERRIGACVGAWQDEALLESVRKAFEQWTDGVSSQIDRYKSGSGHVDDAIAALSDGMSCLLGVVVTYDVQEWIDSQRRRRGRFRRLVRDVREALARYFGR